MALKPSQLLKNAIIEELRKREIEDLRRRIKEAKPILDRYLWSMLLGLLGRIGWADEIRL